MLFEVSCVCDFFPDIVDEGAIEEGDKETLLLTVEALKAQLEEQTRLCKEQVFIILMYLHAYIL